MENENEKEKEIEEQINNQQVNKTKTKLSREEKKKLKFEKRKIKKCEIRKKINKKLKEKLKSLDQGKQEKIYQIKQQAEANAKRAFESGICIYVDLEYDVLMEDREVKSLALQIAHIVGINKELENPVQLHLTNYRGIQAQEMEKQGAKKWIIHKHEKSLDELVAENNSGKEFIYLSPDAEEELQEVNPEQCIYVIGGFVDRQVQKYMSLNKANALQLCARKLPIKQYMKGKNNRPLNIDTVACLLSEQYRLKDWEQALNSARDKAKCSVIHRLQNEVQ